MPPALPSPTVTTGLELSGELYLRKDEDMEGFMALGLDHKAASYALHRAVLGGRVQTIPVHKRLRLYRAADVEAELERHEAAQEWCDE